MSTAENKTIGCNGVKDGEVFRLAGIEFIKFTGTEEGTPVVMRGIAFNSEFGANNDLRESRALERMEKEILPKIVAAIGEENVCTFKTDLTAWDGLKNYGYMESRISLPTMDFYRANVEVFDKYKVDSWWWLATPDTVKPHGKPWWTLCVSPDGDLVSGYGNYCRGVRPFLILKSSIFESLKG